MLITLWVFIGVEGAVVVSARARHKRDVGRATLLAVLSALAVYLLVTLLSLGVVPRSELAEMRNPSMAGLMVRLMGSWGEIVIAAGLIVSVCGAYLSWTIMAAEVPYLAATHKAFPRLFARQNRNNAPSASLWLTNISVQASLVLIWLTGSDYGTLLTIASEMILVPYLLVGAFCSKSPPVRCIKRWVSAPVFMAYGYYTRRDLCICCCRWYFTLRVFWSFCTPDVRTSTIVRSNAANWR